MFRPVQSPFGDIDSAAAGLHQASQFSHAPLDPGRPGVSAADTNEMTMSTGEREDFTRHDADSVFTCAVIQGRSVESVEKLNPQDGAAGGPRDARARWKHVFGRGGISRDLVSDALPHPT